ncbi:MAG: ankyrin repeat domain-containing protein [Pseudomonadota bacterium]|nr:ankyrin repeat domain-containing protein [Pseudomonadota bacterium]
MMIASALDNPDVIKLLLENKAQELHEGWSAVMIAVESNQPLAIKALLEGGCSPNTWKQKSKKTALMFAAESGKYAVLKSLIDHKAKLDPQDSSGKTALMFAVESNQSLAAIKALLAGGADPNIANKEGKTALMFAVESNQSLAIKSLLEGGADPNIANKEGKTALMIAVELGDKWDVELLIDKGADLNMTDKQGKNLMMYAVESGKMEIVELFLKKGSNLKMTDKQGKNSMMYAVESGKNEIVKLFREKDKTLLNTSLRLAVSSNEPKLDMVEKLLKFGANTEDEDQQGHNALDLACSKLRNNTESQLEPPSKVLATKWKIILAILDKGVRLTENGDLLSVVCSTPMLADPREVIQKIIENGSYDPNAKNKEGVTPLMSAISNTGKVENIEGFCDGTDLAKYIIEEVPASIDLDTPDSNGRTALMAAVLNKNQKAIQMLLDKCVDLNIADKEGKTPLRVAVESNNVVAINSLLEGGADPNIADTEGKTPLWVAVDSENQEVINLLLARDADPNIGDKEGKTPLMVAVSDIPSDESETLISSLLSRGANPSLLDNHDRDAFFYSIDARRERGFTKLISKYFETKSSPLDKHSIGFIKYLEDIQRNIVSQENTS